MKKTVIIESMNVTEVSEVLGRILDEINWWANWTVNSTDWDDCRIARDFLKSHTGKASRNDILAMLIVNFNKPIIIIDKVNHEAFELTYKGILDGLSMTYNKNISEDDNMYGNAIVQFALFGDIEYGL